jgi:hypothetical protein
MSFPSKIEKGYPYYNDHDPVKFFQSILFRGGVAPQARELNQIQTLLQEQLSRLSDHIFKNGSSVTGAQFNINNTDGKINLTKGVIYWDKRFHLVQNLLVDDGTFTYYLNSGTDNYSNNPSGVLASNIIDTSTTITLQNVSQFVPGSIAIDSEIISFTEVDYANNQLLNCSRGVAGTITTTHLAGSTAQYISSYSGYKKDETTEYTYIYNPFSTSEYNENPNTDVEYSSWFNSKNFWAGMKIIEEVVTSNEDESLLDNSLHMPNYNAPGANRLKVTVQLDVRPWNQKYSDFIPFLKVKNGRVVEDKSEPQYSEILKYFARVLNETQGNYTVDPYRVSISEWSEKELLNDPTRENTFALNVSSGVAYVGGHRREKLSPTKIKLDKGYSNFSKKFNGVGNQFLAYDSIEVEMDSGYIMNNKLFRYTYDAGSTYFYATARKVEYLGSDIYRIYFSDAQPEFYFNLYNDDSKTFTFYSGHISSSLGSLTGTSVAMTEVTLNSTIGKSLIYMTYPNAVNYSDLTLYTKTYQSSLITTGTGSATLTNVLSSEGEVVPSDSSMFKLASTNPSIEVFVVDSVTGAVVTSGFSLSVSGAGVNQIVWTSGEPANNYYVYFLAYAIGADSTPTEATELRSTTITLSMATPTQDSSKNVDQLFETYFDVYDITEVVQGSTTFKKNVDFVLIDGQTPEYFYVSGIKWLKGKPRPSGSYSATIKYWKHQGSGNNASGSFILSESFKNSDGSEYNYSEISKYAGARRSDFIDFRTRNNQVSIVSDVYTIGQSNLNTFDQLKRTRRIANEKSWAYDVQRYLPRYATVFIDKDGVITLLNGEASFSPQRVKHAEKSLLLANMFIPAYPRSPSDIKMELWKAKRYQQQDIRRIEERVTNLENFTLKNKLELLALNEELGDDDVMRGVMVDDFTGHGVADVFHPEYHAGIDPVEGSLRLPFNHEFVDLSFDISNFESIGSNMSVNGKTVTLGFQEDVYIENNFATGTTNINPYESFTWVGNMVLIPEVDIWTNTTRQPEVLDDKDLANSNFRPNAVNTGWDTEFNFWNNRVFGWNSEDLQGRFGNSEEENGSRTTANSAHTISGRSVDPENELANSPVAWNQRLVGFERTE